MLKITESLVFRSLVVPHPLVVHVFLEETIDRGFREGGDSATGFALKLHFSCNDIKQATQRCRLCQLIGTLSRDDDAANENGP